MVRFLLRWVINAVALYIAIVVVNSTIGGIQLQSQSVIAFLWMALIFGLVNALLRPLISVLTCPLIMLTLGLFTLVINVFLFYLVGYIGTFFNVGYTIDNLLAALLGSIVVSVVSVVLSVFLPNRPRSR
ncbi:MAG: phage holin family protein [Omnitrophica WOR_2 bacterium]